MACADPDPTHAPPATPGPGAALGVRSAVTVTGAFMPRHVSPTRSGPEPLSRLPGSRTPANSDRHRTRATRHCQLFEGAHGQAADELALGDPADEDDGDGGDGGGGGQLGPE